MVDLDTLYDQLMREIIKFMYGSTPLMKKLGSDAFKLIFISQWCLLGKRMS